MLRRDLVVPLVPTQRVAVFAWHLVLAVLAVPIALPTLEWLKFGWSVLAFGVVVHEAEVHLGLVSHVHLL